MTGNRMIPIDLVKREWHLTLVLDSNFTSDQADVFFDRVAELAYGDDVPHDVFMCGVLKERDADV